MKTTLLIMAAGIGSRFGTGIKQLEPVDDAGHIIMDYSIHDAIEAGFNHVVFIIRKDIEKEFKEVIGDRIAEPFPQKRTQKSVKKRNKNTEISRAAIRRRKLQVRPQSVQAKAIQGQNGGGWCCRKLRDRQTHRSVQQSGSGSA